MILKFREYIKERKEEGDLSNDIKSQKSDPDLGTLKKFELEEDDLTAEETSSKGSNLSEETTMDKNS